MSPRAPKQCEACGREWPVDRMFFIRSAELDEHSQLQWRQVIACSKCIREHAILLPEYVKRDWATRFIAEALATGKISTN